MHEALSLLTSDQLVDRIDQRGSRVAQTSRSQFEEILGLRCKLDDLALRESIAAAGSAWDKALVIAHHRMNRAEREQIEGFRMPPQGVSHGAVRCVTFSDSQAFLQPTLRSERGILVPRESIQDVRTPKRRERAP